MKSACLCVLSAAMLCQGFPLFSLGQPQTAAAQARQRKPVANSTTSAPQRGGAESVFATAAPSVVYLLTRSSGAVHARASGIILSADGYIATNYHALEGADTLEVRFFSNPVDSQTYQSFNGAKLLYADAAQDIAILKVTAKSLPFLGCPAQPGCKAQVGARVYAIGNPEGLNNTISEGIVSGLRSTAGEDVIQHTAAISPGSSGGALVDSSGNLVGMNSWQLADAQNLNFAISAKNILEALAAARRQIVSLSFPIEEHSDSTPQREERALNALLAKDYIQAANQTEQAIADGNSSSTIYTILGVADSELGKEDEAEQYFRQALGLVGPDDKFKQTSRLYLLKILVARFSDETSSNERLLIIRLVKAALASQTGSILDSEYYARMRRWAAVLPNEARILGEWFEVQQETLLPGSLCGPPLPTFRVDRSSQKGEFILSGAASTDSEHPVSCTIEGTITPSGEGFSGVMKRRVMTNPANAGVGFAEQSLRIEFTVSDDLTTLEGTATGDKVMRGGEARKLAAGQLSFPSSIGMWHFILRRRE